MSHRSIIALQTIDPNSQPPLTIRAIYCHIGGSIDDNGQKLASHYTDVSKIESLLALGGLSELGKDAGEKVDSAKARYSGVTIAYQRDRGDEPDYSNITHTFTTEAELRQLTNHFDAETMFLHRDGRWWVATVETRWEWRDLNSQLHLVNSADESDLDHWY